MNILVANDDGINARGIKELVKALSDVADIYVCAPESQRSASGHGITVSKPVVAEGVDFENAKLAYSLSGTPADCVKLGLKIYEELGINIDMVFSGINQGSNLGTDTLYSGTVSAALEGSICGKPSVAVSVDKHEAEYFEYACELAVKALKKSYGKLSSDVVLNINTPNLPKDQIKGVKYTTLGAREYNEDFTPIKTEDGKKAFIYSGNPVIYEGLPETIDVIAMQNNYASITPIHRDLTAYDKVEEIRNWRIED